MTLRLALIIITLPISSLTNTQATAQELDALKDATERWIQTRTLISKERSEWNSEKELINGSIDTLESTRNNLEENVGILEIQSSSLRSQIEEAERKVTSYNTTNQLIIEKVSVYEKRILSISERLPDPLKEELAPLLRNIPRQESATTPIPNRLQNVVAIATIIDEFNNNLRLTHTIKTLDDGNVIEVRVLYWGLAGAYASSTDGNNAWIISPAAGNWNWTAAGKDTLSIKQLFDVYDKTIDPTLVKIPFSFQSEGGQK